MKIIYNQKLKVVLIMVISSCLPGLFYSSCKKYLEEKPDQSISTPSTLKDLEDLLNNYALLNARYPSAGEISADNYYLTSTDWAATVERQRNFYLWQKYDDIGGDWSSTYNNIFYANIILESLPGITGDNPVRRNNIEGSALFLRAFYHFSLTQLFAPAYDATTAGTDLGIPLRLHSDISIKPVRTPVLVNFNSILSDLKSAIHLLPIQPSAKFLPGKPAAYAMTARVCLIMNDYKQAGLYADSCLQLNSTLIDYNKLATTATNPFKQFNDEVIYDARSAAPAALVQSKAKVDTALYLSYNANDLRKLIFFKPSTGGHAFKGNYTGLSNAALFAGLATDEMLLIRAECFARNGKLSNALLDINGLLSKRYKINTYQPFESSDQDAVINLILNERRKELLFRTIRWSDLRRLNKDQKYTRSIYRNINNQLYELKPNSNRYMLQVDRQAVMISGIPQNP